MLKNLKFPWIYVLELALWLPLIGGFMATVGFLNAKAISTIDLHGKTLPANWEAAVASHGRFLEWYLINNHPIAFGTSLLVLLTSALALYPVYKAQQLQRQAAQHAGSIAHKVAQACVMGALIVIGYFILTRLLVGISPA